jgi:hypothetical protein
MYRELLRVTVCRVFDHRFEARLRGAGGGWYQPSVSFPLWTWTCARCGEPGYSVPRG